MQVKKGDTASHIAVANRPVGVSLDQMLQAMVQANPDAFIGGNVHRLKAGAVLVMPTAQQAQAISRDDARRAMALQTDDFDAFRRKLAELAILARESPQQQRGLRASVADKAAPDRSRLSLSAGAVAGIQGEQAIARDLERQALRARQLTEELKALAEPAAAASGAQPSARAASKPASAASATAAARAASASRR